MPLLEHKAEHWPQSYAQVVLDAIPASLLTQITADAAAVAALPNFWLPVAELRNPSSCRASGEAVVQQLYHTVVRHLLQGRPEISGAEWWIQVYEEGRGLDFHFDKDERLFAQQRIMKQPCLSSVLYLSGDPLHPRLGPTVVVEQVFDGVQSCVTPSVPSKSALVFPTERAYLVFDGCLGHGVLGSFHAGKRMTMLINWWHHQPQGITRITEAQASKMSHPVVVPDLRPEQACEMAGSCTGRPHEPAVLEASTSDPQVLLVDDLLDEHGIKLQGPDAAHMIAISHAGLQLYPLDEDQEGLETKPAVAAALVPINDDAGSSDCSSDSSDHSKA